MSAEDKDELEKELLARGDEETWTAFWKANALLAHRIVERKLGIWQENDEILEDIRSEAVMKLIEKLRAQKVRSSTKRYFCGIVNKLCSRQLEKFAKTDRGDAVSRHDLRTPSIPLRKEDEFKALLRALRLVFQHLREEIKSELQAKRASRRNSPLLHLLVMDQFAMARITPSSLKKALGIKDGSEVTRLRDAAIDRFKKLCLANGLSDDTMHEDNAAMVFPALEDAWVVGMHGCDAELLCQDMHPSHREDLELQRRAHIEIARCHLCLPCEEAEEAHLIKGQMALYMETTSRSLESFKL